VINGPYCSDYLIESALIPFNDFYAIVIILEFM